MSSAASSDNYGSIEEDPIAKTAKIDVRSLALVHID